MYSMMRMATQLGYCTGVDALMDLTGRSHVGKLWCCRAEARLPFHRGQRPSEDRLPDVRRDLATLHEVDGTQECVLLLGVRAQALHAESDTTRFYGGTDALPFATDA